jgi:hypothetical protein
MAEAETVSETPTLKVVWFKTPMGVRYIFICREGHRHEARHECANCSRDTAVRQGASNGDHDSRDWWDPFTPPRTAPRKRREKSS